MILEQVLLEFPLVEVEFHMPRWVEMLPTEHPVKQELIEKVRSMMDQFRVCGYRCCFYGLYRTPRGIHKNKA